MEQNNKFKIPQSNEFKESFPWIGGDLQTIRDSFCLNFKFSENTEKILVPVNNINSNQHKGEFILGYLEFPNKNKIPKGLIFLTHGLGGSTKRYGLRRIAKIFLDDGFAIFKLNLRGAGSGRYLSKNNYSARCSNDIISAVDFLKNNYFLNSKNLKNNNFLPPFFAVGLSLGGTILLNACLDYKKKDKLFDGIACVSTPVDLLSSSKCIEKSRNYFYQKWLINRLKKQVIKSSLYENSNFKNKELINKIKTIKEFDKYLTAPMWGYSSVDDYYFKASPIHRIKNEISKLPATLLIHAKDDPWVPYKPTLELKNSLKDFKNCIQFLISEKGGHNGFHSPKGCWSDEVVKNWINLSLNNK